MEASNKTFAKTSEVLDGNLFTDCKFDECTLVYRGGAIPQLNRCHFNNCQWRFEEAAERTLEFMRQIYHGMGPGGRELLEATMAQIRNAPTRQ